MVVKNTSLPSSMIFPEKFGCIFQEKSKDFTVFKSFKVHVEKEVRKSIKSLRTNQYLIS